MAEEKLEVKFFFLLSTRQEKEAKRNAPPPILLRLPPPTVAAEPPVFHYNGYMIDELRSAFAKEGNITFSLKVHANASKTQIKGRLDDGTYKIDVAAVPEDGKANKELISFLAKTFGVPKNQIEIVSGQTSQLKKVRITSFKRDKAK